MPRPPRADEAGGLYRALNRANMRATIFKKEDDYADFERILFEGLELHDIELSVINGYPIIITWSCGRWSTVR